MFGCNLLFTYHTSASTYANYEMWTNQILSDILDEMEPNQLPRYAQSQHCDNFSFDLFGVDPNFCLIVKILVELSDSNMHTFKSNVAKKM